MKTVADKINAPYQGKGCQYKEYRGQNKGQGAKDLPPRFVHLFPKLLIFCKKGLGILPAAFDILQGGKAVLRQYFPAPGGLLHQVVLLCLYLLHLCLHI